MPPRRTAANKPPLAANPVDSNQLPRDGRPFGKRKSAAAVMLNVEVSVLPEVAGKVTLAGFSEQEILTAAELALHVKFTAPVKPFIAVMVMLDVPA